MRRIAVAGVEDEGFLRGRVVVGEQEASDGLRSGRTRDCADDGHDAFNAREITSMTVMVVVMMMMMVTRLLCNQSLLTHPEDRERLLTLEPDLVVADNKALRELPTGPCCPV